jgi:hypothetical protein
MKVRAGAAPCVCGKGRKVVGASAGAAARGRALRGAEGGRNGGGPAGAGPGGGGAWEAWVARAGGVAPSQAGGAHRSGVAEEFHSKQGSWRAPLQCRSATGPGGQRPLEPRRGAGGLDGAPGGGYGRGATIRWRCAHRVRVGGRRRAWRRARHDNARGALWGLRPAGSTRAELWSLGAPDEAVSRPCTDKRQGKQGRLSRAREGERGPVAGPRGGGWERQRLCLLRHGRADKIRAERAAPAARAGAPPCQAAGALPVQGTARHMVRRSKWGWIAVRDSGRACEALGLA